MIASDSVAGEGTRMVSQAAGKLFTNPPRVAVTRMSVDVWVIPFGAVLAEGETIASVAATIVPVSSQGADEVGGAAVSDFVASTDVDDDDPTVVNIGWLGEALIVDGLYLVEIAATLNTEKVRVLLRHVECVA